MAAIKNKPAKSATEAKRDIERSFSAICDFVPEHCKGSDAYKDAFILFSDSFDSLLRAKENEISNLQARVTDLTEEISDLEENEIDEEEHSELQDFREKVEGNQIDGIEPIYWAANNSLDTQLMEAFGSLLQRHRPLDLLEKINSI